MYKSKFVLIACFIIVPKIHAANNEPLLQINPKEYDMGEPLTGEKKTTELLIANKGQIPVKIKRITSSCGCLVTSCTKKLPLVLEPNDTLKIVVEIDGLHIEGELRKHVYIYTNNPKEEVYVFLIKGKFISTTHQLCTIPIRVELGETYRGQNIKRNVIVQRKGLVPVGPLKVVSSADWIKATIKKENNEEETLKLLVSASLDKIHETYGSLKDEIILYGADANDFVRIPVTGKVMPDIQISPNIIMYEKNKHTYKLKVTNHCNEMTTLEKSIFDGPGFVYEGITDVSLESPNCCWLTVKLSKVKRDSKLLKGSLKLYFQKYNEPVRVIFVAPAELTSENIEKTITQPETEAIEN